MKLPNPPILPFAPFALAAALTVLGVLAPTGGAFAATKQACLAGQLRPSGASCLSVTKCYGKALKKGAAVDPACFAGGTAKLAKSLTVVESQSVCLTEGEAPTVSTALHDGVDPMFNALTPTGGKCAARKMAALGKECAGYFRCYANAAAISDTPDTGCLAAYKSRLEKLFAKAEAKGDCATTGDAASLEGMVTSVADNVFLILRGSGSTTTTGTVPVSSTSTTTIP